MSTDANPYSECLSGFLAREGNNEASLAEQIGKAQPTVNRYRNGRLPDAATAKAIHSATDGAVSFDLWRDTFMSKAGLAA